MHATYCEMASKCSVSPAQCALYYEPVSNLSSTVKFYRNDRPPTRPRTALMRRAASCRAIPIEKRKRVGSRCGRSNGAHIAVRRAKVTRCTSERRLRPVHWPAVDRSVCPVNGQRAVVATAEICLYARLI